MLTLTNGDQDRILCSLSKSTNTNMIMTKDHPYILYMKEGSAAAGSPSTTMFRLIKTIRQLEASISSIRLNSFL